MAGIRRATNSAGVAELTEKRREQVAALKLRGLSEREVHEALKNLGLMNPKTGQPWSLSIIHKDLVLLRNRWRERADEHMALHKARVLAEIEQVKRRCWTDGDMKNLLAAINMQVRLFGLEAPVKVAPVMPDGEEPFTLQVDELTVSELRTLEKVLATAGEIVSRKAIGDDRTIDVTPAA